MKDLVYIYDKEDFTRSELGEIQRDFNFSFVIDGTKDSAKVIILNHSGTEVEPLSIVKHSATETWWVVSHDKVTRYANEDSTYFYTHELELLGAIELLNARDLTDSGFNQNRYTISEFIARILNHSNFEFKDSYTIDYQDNLDQDKNVDYVKTFENYTPLSAIREFIDGYNCAIKLDFVEDDSGTIESASFYIVSKSGNINGTTWEEDEFNEVQETKTMDKNSFGTSVISNAENVISTKTKTYPTAGGVKLSANAYEIDGASALLRLPSNVFKVNNILMGASIGYLAIGPWTGVGDEPKVSFNPFDTSSIESAIAEMRVLVTSIVPNALTWFDNTFTVEKIQEDTLIKLYNEENYDPVNKVFISDYAQYTYTHIISTTSSEDRQLFLSSKELRDNVESNTGGIYYERGNNTIEGFEFFQANDNTQSYINKDIGYYEYDDDGTVYEFFVGNLSSWDSSSLTYSAVGLYNIWDMCFIINYIPMSDIKIKVDNTREKRDSQLFNQNGKLTDSVALSKRLLSYSKEIESDNITKYGAYYFKNEDGTITDNMPKVGDLVSIDSEIYVINNVSLDFFENEVEDIDSDINYYVRAEFTMSKNVAVKSLMTNPNTNIRDYGIPQNNNVKRKQLYRDFYELGHTQESDSTSWYQPLSSVLNVGNDYNPYQEHIAIIKLTFDGAYGGTPSDTWYYQLESTTYVMKKMVYEVIDFKDNNIIGYGSQNVWCGFDITRVFQNQIDYISTPISYVDSNGEFVGVTMALCTGEQITSIYDGYEEAMAEEYSTYYSSWTSTSLYNYSVFIPSEIYEGEDYSAIDSGNYDFIIEEDEYYKDALEVPVFEYVCQIDDSSQVIIGENILDTYSQDNAYLYSYVFVSKDKYNNNNYGNVSIGSVSIDTDNIATLSNAVKLEYNSDSELKITLYDSVSYDLTTKTATYGTQQAFDTTKDLMIIRHRILEEDLYRAVIGELIRATVYSDLPDTSSDYYGKYAIMTDDKYYLCSIVEQTPEGTLLNTNTTYYYNSASSNNIPTTDLDNYTLCIAVYTRIDPSSASDTYTLADTGTGWYYDTFSGETNLTTPSESNSLRLVTTRTPSNIPSSYQTLYSTTIYGIDALPSATSDNLGMSIIAKQVTADYTPSSGIMTAYPLYTTSVYNPTHLPSTGYSGDCIAVRLVYGSDSNIRLYQYITGAGYQATSIYLTVEGENNVEGKYFLLDDGNGRYYYWSGSSWTIYSGTTTTNYYLYQQVTLGTWDLVAQDTLEDYYYRYDYDFYTWEDGALVDYTLTYTTEKKFGVYNSGWTFIDTNTTTSYYYTSGDVYYIYNGTTWSEVSYTYEWHYFTGLTLNQPYEDIGELESGDIFLYNGLYYQWNGSEWENATTYEWSEGVSASGEYFTYGGTLYQYNATTNTLVQISSDTSIDREDLMFIIRDMEDSDITSDELSLYINYYSTN